MLGRITIETRGVQGAAMLAREFTAGILQRLSPVMLQTAKELRSVMQSRAPVRTGFMRNFIQESQRGTHEVMIVSAASYSGLVNYGLGTNRFIGPRPFFTSVIDEMGERAFTDRFAQESLTFLNQLISKYQHGP